MGHNAAGGTKKRPKINCVAALEGSKDLDVDYERHVDCKGEHSDKDGGTRCIWRQRATDNTAVTSIEEDHASKPVEY